MYFYNDEYVKNYPEKEYIDVLLNKEILDGITYFYTNRYSTDPNFEIDIKFILFKESLDHYIVKKINQDEKFIGGELFFKYLKYIENIFKSDPTEFTTNIVFQNEELKEKILNRFYANSKEYYLKIEDNISSNFSDIINKIQNREEIYQNEIDYICSFLAKYKFNVEGVCEVVLKYIFGDMRTTDLKFSYPVQEFVLSRLPFEYKSYPIKDCRIDIATHASYEAVKGPGVSNGRRSNALINRKYYGDISLKSIDDSKVSRKRGGTDFTHFLTVALHELTHQYQRERTLENDLDDIGLSAVVSYCLDSVFKDYRTNHDNNAMEMDADKYSWIESKNFYLKYLSGSDRDQLIQNCENNIQTCIDRRLIACKYNSKSNLILLYDDYDAEFLYKVVVRKPELLTKYPMLKNIFTYSYEDKKLNFNMEVLFKNNFTSDNIMEFINYYFAFNKHDELIEYLKHNIISYDKVVFLISNFIYYIESQYEANGKIDQMIERNNLGDTSSKRYLDIDTINRIKTVHLRKAGCALKETLKVLKIFQKDYPQLNNFFKDSLVQLKNNLSLTDEDIKRLLSE